MGARLRDILAWPARRHQLIAGGATSAISLELKFSSVYAGSDRARAANGSPVVPRPGLCQRVLNAGFDIAFGLTTNCGKSQRVERKRDGSDLLLFNLFDCADTVIGVNNFLADLEAHLTPPTSFTSTR